MIQFEFVRLLVERIRQERDRPSEVRGFVSASELYTALSWDTNRPSDNHVKQSMRTRVGADAVAVPRTSV